MRRASRPTTATRSPTSRDFPSPPSTISATTTRSACSPCRGRRCAASTRRAARRGVRPSSATHRTISTPGRISWPARSAPPVGGRGDIVHVAYGYGLFTGGLGAHYGAERLGCTVVPVSGGMTPRQVQLIRDFEPSIIMVTPSYMLALLDEFERQGVDPRTCSLRIGIFGAEPWTEAMRAEIEERLRHARRRHLRPVRGDGAGRVAGVRRDQGRPAHLGGPLLSRGHRPGQRRRCSRTESSASWSSRR